MIRREDQPDGRGRAFGMPHDVVQCLLQNPIAVDGLWPAAHRSSSLLLVPYLDAGLFTELGDVPLDRFFEAEIVEDRWMQRLREAAQVFERRLGDLADLR